MTTYNYDVNGRLVKTERPNKTVETRTYDKAGHLIQILDKCGETIVNQQDYSYDAEGNITEVKQLYNSELDFTGVTSAKMTYDKNNRLLTYNGEKIEYDKDGNMTYGPLQGKMTKFEFDCRNRLVKAGDTSYTYDAENNRIAVTAGTKRTEYVINTQPELSQVLQGTVTNGGRVETTYYFYGKGLIAQENSASGYLTYHFNNVGSTMAVTDQGGKVKYSYNYSPYGELLEGEYSDTIPFLFNGQYGVTTDANGLYYMRARYYNVDIKRFVNQDVLTGTLERISSLNRYSYVEGNPVSYLDPFGLERSFLEDLHEYLQVMATIVMVMQLVLAGVMAITMVSNPAAFLLALEFETGLSTAANVISGLDFVVSLLLIRERDSAEEKFLALKDAGFDLFGIGVSGKFDPIMKQLGVGYELEQIFYQTVSGIQQCLYNMTE